MDPLKVIQIEALYALTKDTPEYNLREMQRWYSEKFNTPLHVVEDELEPERVALHYYECKYNDMTPEEREDEMKRLTETDTERMERLRKEEADSVNDDEFLKQTIEEAKKATGALRGLASVARDPNDQEPIIPVSVMGTNKPTTFNEHPPAPPIKIPEGIQMDFSGAEDDVGEWDLFGPQKDD